METSNIIKHLETEAIIKNRGEGELKAHLVRAILNVYALTGASKNYNSTEEFDIEVTMIADALVRAILSDSSLRCMRLTEIIFCFSAGVKGEFDHLKTFGINYQTLYKWLKAYANSWERAEALKMHLRNKERLMIAQKSTITEEEKRRIIIEGINNSYSEYLSCSQIKKGTIGSIFSKNGAIVDLTHVRDRFLTKEGKKEANMSLLEFFEQCKKQKLDKIF